MDNLQIGKNAFKPSKKQRCRTTYCHSSISKGWCCGDWIRTNDLQVMSLASYQLLPLRDMDPLPAPP